MIRVTFDRDYVDNLEDYYRRNECIREQQYVSRDKLLHLAAFCISKVAGAANEGGDLRHKAPRAEAALDAVRELAQLCERAIQADASIKPIVVVGKTSTERVSCESHAISSAVPTFDFNGGLRVLPWWTAAGSMTRAVAGWLKW